MKLLKAMLVSICILPLAAVSYAEDVDTQNLRISETSIVSMNEAEPNMQMNNTQMEMENQPGAMNNSGNTAEVDNEQGFRWPWQVIGDALKFRKDFKNLTPAVNPVDLNLGDFNYAA